MLYNALDANGNCNTADSTCVLYCLLHIIIMWGQKRNVRARERRRRSRQSILGGYGGGIFHGYDDDK